MTTKKENLRLFEKRIKELQEEHMKNNPDVQRQLQIQKAKNKLEKKLEQQLEKDYKKTQNELWGENNYLNLIFTKFINLLIYILSFINFIYESDFDFSSNDKKPRAEQFIESVLDLSEEVLEAIVDEEDTVGGKKKSKKTRKKKNTRKNKRKK